MKHKLYFLLAGFSLLVGSLRLADYVQSDTVTIWCIGYLSGMIYMLMYRVYENNQETK